jgi:hypothetical protein
MGRKYTVSPIGERLANRVNELLSKGDATCDALAPALCPNCIQSWSLWPIEDAQFVHTHRCTRGRRKPKFVIRIAIERIGKCRAEREALAVARRRRLAGKL